MIALWLGIMMFQQGNPIALEAGMMSGILRTAAGNPAPKVRVAAAICSSISSESIVLVRLTETDDGGRFILEEIPPGRYCLLAGAIERPTYYPGTLDSTRETILTLGPSSALTGLDFIIDNSSSQPRVSAGGTPQRIRLNLPIQVLIEGEDNQPVFSDLQPAIIRFTSTKTGDILEIPLSDKSIQIPVKSDGTEEYQVRVEKLSPAFNVKDLTFNGIDLRMSPLKASIDVLFPSIPLQIVTFGGPGTLQATVDRAMRRLTGFRGLSVVLARTPH